jgi:leucyl aminopeptidase
MSLTLLTSPLELDRESADFLIVPVWEEGPATTLPSLDSRLQDILHRLREGGDLSGRAGEIVLLHQQPHLAVPRVLVLGLGKQTECHRGVLYRSATAAGRVVSAKKRGKILLVLPGRVADLSWSDLALALGTGFLNGCRGPGIRQSEPGRHEPDQVVVVPPEQAPRAEVESAVRRAACEAKAVLLARDLVNEPPCDLYPETFAQRAAAVARSVGVSCTIFDEKQLASERMGCLLGVAQGSDRPPRLVVLRYQGGTGPLLALVGKGVTFDSGGLSLKTNEQMLEMKCDMAGAATVLAAVQAIAELKLPVHVLGILALVENMPSGRALKLGDVLKARNGKTAEIHNTDAEGRLILADALCYAVDQRATHIVDLATLTGACMVALGADVTGLMSNDSPWAERVLQATRQAGEAIWQLPMYKEYNDLIKSKVADIKNVGGKYGGAITAAKFLEAFVGTTPWCHLDIAGPAFASEETPQRDAGGTGCMVRGLVELAHQYR